MYYNAQCCVECEGNFDANGDCNNGFALPDCCNCPPGLTEVNGVCSEFYYYRNIKHRVQNPLHVTKTKPIASTHAQMCTCMIYDFCPCFDREYTEYGCMELATKLLRM